MEEQTCCPSNEQISQAAEYNPLEKVIPYLLQVSHGIPLDEVDN
ncbi:hypothetical protein [Pseudomonas alkylphenolica]|nr:hypothetical protein [Pseudomonas alkylphenolica]